jgi:uncharacterized protein Usg
MKSVRLFVLVVVSAVALVVSASPAQAYSRVYHGYDFAETHPVRDDFITVCDREADGHGVWTDYYTSDLHLHTKLDGNGSASGCGVDWVYPRWIHSYRVCERYVSCTDWRRTDGPGGG